MGVRRLLKSIRRKLRDIWLSIFYKIEFNSSDRLRKGEAFFDHVISERFGSNEVGFAFTKLALEQWKFNPVVVINELQIYEKYQGRGLGSYLLRTVFRDYAFKSLDNFRDAEVREVLSKVEVIALKPVPGGVGGIRFDTLELIDWYKKFGFRQSGDILIYRIR